MPCSVSGASARVAMARSGEPTLEAMMSIRGSARWRRTTRAVMAVSLAVVPAAGWCQSAAPRAIAGWSGDPPAIAALVDAARTESDLRVAVTRYLADKAAIERRYD